MFGLIKCTTREAQSNGKRDKEIERLRFMDTEIHPIKEIERWRGRQPMIKTREINRKYATLATKVAL